MNICKALPAVVVSLLTIFLVFLIFPYSGGRPAPYSPITELNIFLALQDFAQKHNGRFPEGNSSTEVFQKLIDDGYIEPKWFYIPMPGKTRAASRKLLPENVCFDITGGANAASPDWLPLVFSSGYRIDYKTGIAERSSAKYSVDYNTLKAIKYSYWSPDDEPLTVTYAHTTRLFPSISYHHIFFRKEATSFNIMPGKPENADISGYQQLTPNGK